MRTLPVGDPGTPDIRSATRYLWWLTRNQWKSISTGMLYGITWMLCMALVPAVIGAAVDAGVTGKDMDALARWAGAFVILGLIQATCGIMRHRNAVFNWLSASFRTVQVTVAHAGKLGATLPKRMATGEVVAIGAADTGHVGNALDISARGAAAVVSLIVVTIILLTTSVKLGLVVLFGVPVLMAVVSFLIKPLHRRQQAYRDQQGALTGRATDIVVGLRVLRGIGGESVFAARYATESQRLRQAGVQTARIDSVLAATQVLMPGLFLVLVTWLGARLAMTGEITAGQLVSFYGYAAFLVIPLRTFAEMLDKMTRGHVAAGRVLRMLNLEPEIAEPADALALPRDPAPLVDPDSGLVVRPGVYTALAASRPEDAVEIADRLGGYTASEVTLGGVPLARVARAQVRERILVADNNARLFSGTLRDELSQGLVQDAAADPAGSPNAGPTDLAERDPVVEARLRAAMWTASGDDILAALPDGLDTFVAERGREFSGGQQQRIRLARALLADRPILILVEPTSAVDAHTEARIAERVGAHRSGATTLVTTTSPLVLDRADHVVFVHDGRVVAAGAHRELLVSEPRYRALVTRTDDDDATPLHAVPQDARSN